MTLVIAEVVKNTKSVMENSKLKLGRYRYYKGGEYRLIGLAKYSETLEDMVIYEALYENKMSKVWVRPVNVFMSSKNIDGNVVSRFEYIGE